MPQEWSTLEADITAGDVHLPGVLGIPAEAGAIVLFAHGSGSSRLSPRNTYVAEVLNRAGLATLLFDLLTEREDAVYETRFDIDLLSRRMMDAAEWARTAPSTKGLRAGFSARARELRPP